VAAGTGNVVSRTYCGTNTTSTQTVNVGLSVTDATSQSGSATYVTTIYYSPVYTPPPGGGGCSVTDGNVACN
jgi:hypothetical protein